MNYFIADIEDFKKEYPDPKDPEVAGRFKDLDKYLDIAQRVIKKFGGKHAQQMLNSEDAISEIARKLMMADWSYDKDKGRTLHSYGNYCGINAIKDYQGYFKTKANKSHYSLDVEVGGEAGESVPISSLTEDVLAKPASLLMSEGERKTRVQRYISFLMKNSKLTEVQKKCLYLRYFAPNYREVDGETRYFEGIESHAEIGEHFEPPISRQAVKQSLDRSLYKLKQTAKGTV